MTITELLTPQYVADETGRKKAVQLDLDVWEQIVSLLTTLDADEQLWDKAFANSQDVLAALADEAAAERRAGRAQTLDPDRL